MKENALKWRLIFENISDDMEEVGLMLLVEEYAKIKSLQIPRRENNKSKGFGIIEFETEEDALNVKHKLDGVQLHGRTLNIRFDDEEKKKSYDKNFRNHRRNQDFKRKDNDRDNHLDFRKGEDFLGNVDTQTVTINPYVMTVHDIKVVCGCIRGMQKSKVIKNASNASSEDIVFYNDRSIDVKNIDILKSEIPKLIQDLIFYGDTNKIFSNDSDIFTKVFVECLTCFLVCFSSCLIEMSKLSEEKRIAFTLAVFSKYSMNSVLKMLNNLMKLLGCSTRVREVALRKIISQL